MLSLCSHAGAERTVHFRYFNGIRVNSCSGKIFAGYNESVARLPAESAATVSRWTAELIHSPLDLEGHGSSAESPDAPRKPRATFRPVTSPRTDSGWLLCGQTNERNDPTEYGTLF